MVTKVYQSFQNKPAPKKRKSLNDAFMTNIFVSCVEEAGIGIFEIDQSNLLTEIDVWDFYYEK
ncbi:hypothetical protein [Enterococcus xiangfangensis]|uniref:hypothetical protein n=1 Tax=Enterococcus xiangfangensis TaxID=1296537 RepID=UPI003D174F7D